MSDAAGEQPTEQRSPIRGKVAAILNEREIAINVGADAGVERGMRFRVLEPDPRPVLDPDSDEILGVIAQEKVRVRALDIHDRFAVCRTYEVSGLPSSLRTGEQVRAGEVAEPERRVRTLRREDSRALAPLSPDESYVEIGDVVEEVILSRVSLREALAGRSQD